MVGGTSYLIELLCIYIIRFFTHNDLLAIGISFWVGLVVSFLMQKLIAFKNNVSKGRQIAKQSITYGLLVCINYTFTLWFSWLFSPIVGVLVARTAALAATTTWNYFVYKHIIFKQS